MDFECNDHPYKLKVFFCKIKGFAYYEYYLKNKNLLVVQRMKVRKRHLWLYEPSVLFEQVFNT